ncbi:MAG: hypothetical protein NE328_17325, partial [Lentisphaeraceae bacterium]|nr:hypothetical protein [Lentisphaeraceae bacterium]
MTPLSKPGIDPTPVFELFRGNHATELLVAANANFKIFDLLSSPKSFEDLKNRLVLEDRPLNVLLTALRAMNLVELNEGLYSNH